MNKNDEVQQNKPSLKRTVLETVLYLIFAVAFIILVPKYLIERVSVEGSSMNYTLSDKDQLIGEKLSVRFNRLKRYDIIYFHPKGDYEVVPYIKRIIGLPGETVQIIDSVIYIDGRPIEDGFAAEDEFEAYSASKKIVLGDDEFFVMGDNRNKSKDSRSSSVGSVKLSDIEGRAVFRIWPISAFGGLN